MNEMISLLVLSIGLLTLLVTEIVARKGFKN